MTVINIRGAREAPRSMRSKMDTLELTPEIMANWTIPPFQRPLKVNDKVRAIAEELKHNRGTIDGVLTLGRVTGNDTMYLIDGQHRVEAAKISGIEIVYADVRIVTFDNIAEMGEEFVKLNSAIVRIGPDDILRGLEQSIQALRIIRNKCQFVGYDNVRRTSTGSPVVSMSMVLRCWAGSAQETPVASRGSAQSIAGAMSASDAEALAVFLNIAFQSWGRDPENFRLWGALNMALVMWMWRRLVLDTDRPGNTRYVVLSKDQFKRALMSVSATRDYVDWLVGRNTLDRDRSPCYARLKAIFTRRLREESGNPKKWLLPQPAWATAR